MDPLLRCLPGSCGVEKQTEGRGPRRDFGVPLPERKDVASLGGFWQGMVSFPAHSSLWPAGLPAQTIKTLQRPFAKGHAASPLEVHSPEIKVPGENSVPAASE